MFHEPQQSDSFDQILPAEQVLARCGFLWAFNKIWAEGISSQIGSLHDLDASTLNQVFGQGEDSVYDIIFMMTDQRIRQVKQVPKFENHYCDDEREFQLSSRPNPDSDGETIAERIIATIGLPLDWIRERVMNNDLSIRQIVIRSPGPVDRTQHYYIFERDSRTCLENLVPLLLYCAPNFIPKRDRQRQRTSR